MTYKTHQLYDLMYVCDMNYVNFFTIPTPEVQMKNKKDWRNTHFFITITIF